MENYQKIISLLDQIIEYNYIKDQLEKDSQETGLDWNTHYLKLLKDLIKQNEK